MAIIIQTNNQTIRNHLFWHRLLRKLHNKMTLITTDDKVFELQPGETLLEGLERTGHEVEYQCRSGYCGSCRVKIVAGTVDYDELPLAFIGPGEILPCCCTVREPVTLECKSRQSEPDLFDDDLFAAYE